MEVVGLIFDLDDVLFDDTFWSRWLFRLVRRLGAGSSYETFVRQWQQQYAAGVHSGRCEFWTALREHLTAHGLTEGQVEEILIAAAAQRRKLLGQVLPLPGVPSTLRVLCGHRVPMAILCNTHLSSHEMRQILAQMRLAGCFPVVLSSSEMGVRMPEAEAYYAALDRMGLRPSEAAFVGHDSEQLAGARAIGMRTVAFNYDATAEADCFLQHFAELLSAVRFRSTKLLAG